MPIHLHIVYGYIHSAKLNSGHRDGMTHKN